MGRKGDGASIQKVQLTAAADDPQILVVVSICNDLKDSNHASCSCKADALLHLSRYSPKSKRKVRHCASQL